MMKFTYFLILIAACLVAQSRAYPFPDPDPEPEPDEGETPAPSCDECKADDPPVKPPNPEKCKADADACVKWNAANDAEKVECTCTAGGDAAPTTVAPVVDTCDECKAPGEGETPVKPDPAKCKADSDACTKWNAANEDKVDCTCGAGGGGPAVTPGGEDPTDAPAKMCNTEAYCTDATMNEKIEQGKCTASSIGCLNATEDIKNKCNCEAKCDADGSDCLNKDADKIIDSTVCTVDSVGCVKAKEKNADLKCSCTKPDPGNPGGDTTGGKGDPGNLEVSTTGMPGGPEATTAGSTRTTAAQLFVLVSSVLSFLLL